MINRKELKKIIRESFEDVLNDKKDLIDYTETMKEHI